MRCTRHLSEGLKNHLGKETPDITQGKKVEICNALFENPNCLAASLTWDDFAEQELALDEYHQYFDYEYMEALIKIVKSNVAIRMKFPNLPYNGKTNIAESEHHRGKYNLLIYVLKSLYILSW